MIADFIAGISAWVTGFISVIVSALTAFVEVFSDTTTSELTILGSLALLGLGIGLVTLAIAFVRGLFQR